MKKINDGLVYTNDKCIGCNKCIYFCPVAGANVSKVSGERKTIEVAADKCIHCGACVHICSWNARKYKDDSEGFFESMRNREEISVALDPSFYVIFGEAAYKIIGYLKSSGVKKVYDVAYGGQISLWGHVKYLHENADNPSHAFIGNTCTITRKYIEQYCPELIPYIIPVKSPLECLGTYVRKYLHDEGKIAYIGPCIAKKDETGDAKYSGGIDYSLTYESIYECAKTAIKGLFYDESDLKGDCAAAIACNVGGFAECVSMYASKSEVLTTIPGRLSDKIRALKSYSNSGVHVPYFVEAPFCKRGCLEGPAVHKVAGKLGDRYGAYAQIREKLSDKLTGAGSPDENYELLCEQMKDLSIDDFTRTFDNRYRQPFLVPQSAYDEVFAAMRKDTEEKKHIDCRSCGYQTCYEMAKAIAYGYNRKENCIHYTNDELQASYYTDMMTKLFNREGFIQAAAQMLKDNGDREYLICVMQINKLNTINDLYGFATGNKVIVRTADKVLNFVGGRGIVGRSGGGEFYFCIEKTEDIINQLKNIPAYDLSSLGVSFPATIKVGAYVKKPSDSESIGTMINLATLTRDKIEESTESVTVFYDDKLKDKLAKESLITARMFSALNEKEFKLYFQPQYNHKTGRLIGAEVLCRWITSDGDMISPASFIPIFERNGFIKELDKYMIENTFAKISYWLERNVNPPVISINVSRITLLSDDFMETFKAIYDKYPVPKEYVHIEITESVYASSVSDIIKRVEEIKEFGFRVAMDDFGSGYSSLNSLKDVPIDILKLDMGFVRGDTTDKGESIIRHVVSMAIELRLDMIAEGVETLEQADFLKHVGCNIIQGYFYAKPMPVTEFEHTFENQ